MVGASQRADDAGALLPLLSTRDGRTSAQKRPHHHHHHGRQTDDRRTFVVENCFANLVPKTKLSVFVFSTIFLVLPELILDKKEKFDSCLLGKFLLV